MVLNENKLHFMMKKKIDFNERRVFLFARQWKRWKRTEGRERKTETYLWNRLNLLVQLQQPALPESFSFSSKDLVLPVAVARPLPPSFLCYTEFHRKIKIK